MMGQARRNDLPPRAITTSDALWLGRALYGEGGRADRAERLALASTMLRGWLLSGQPSFGTWLRGFSQPINPRWLPGAELWNAHVAALARGERRGQEGATSAAAGARRRAIQALGWSDLPADLRADVVGILTGRLPLVAGKASNFAGPNLYRGQWGLDTSSEAKRLATAPAAVRARETARRQVAPEYVHATTKATGNVFHSIGPGRASSFSVVAGPDADALPAPPAAPIGGSKGLVWPIVAALVVALGVVWVS